MSPDPNTLEPGSPEYWDNRYESVGENYVSWFEAVPSTSLELIAKCGTIADGIVDVGGGASRLVDELLKQGYHDLTVVDLSAEALKRAHDRVGESPIHWIATDIRDWRPDRTFDLWHDRAAYHFLVDADDQQRYWDLVRQTVPVGGHLIIATFDENGPDMCSGLPVCRYSQAQIAEAMGPGFEIAEQFTEIHETPAENTQEFQWTLAHRI